MAVDAYVEQPALWGRVAGEGKRTLLVEHGELDLDVLCTYARTDVGTHSRVALCSGRADPGRGKGSSASSPTAPPSSASLEPC